MDTDARDNLNEQGAQHAHSNEATSLLRGNRDLAVLYTIASQLNRKVDVREMLQEVLSQVTRLFGLQTGWVWLLNEERRPFLAAALALPPYLGDHHERMEGSCLCLDTFLSGTLAGAANIDVRPCSRLKNPDTQADPPSHPPRVHPRRPLYLFYLT